MIIDQIHLMSHESLKYCENYQSVTHKHEVSKCYWRNDASRLAWCRIATDLQFVKIAVSTQHNKAKCNKMRYACTHTTSLRDYFENTHLEYFMTLIPITFLHCYIQLCYLFPDYGLTSSSILKQR